MTADLLPPNATAQERALSSTTARIDALPVPIRHLWNPETCPAEHLPWLAWALSVDDWNADWPEETKRAAIKASYLVHRHKGTPGAVRIALQAVGYRDVQIVEGVEPIRHDGTINRSGLHLFATAGHWALFRVVLDLGNSMGVDIDTPTNVRRAINAAKNARSHLYAIGYRVTLSDVRPGEGAEDMYLRVGLKLKAYRAGLRDGSFTRSDAGPWLRDGSILYDGPDRRGHIAGPYFGQPCFASPLRLRTVTKSERTAHCPRDGSIRYDGRSRADGSALDRRTGITLRRPILRNGSHVRNGAACYGTLKISLPSFESPYPVRDGRHIRDGVLTFAHAELEAA